MQMLENKHFNLSHDWFYLIPPTSFFIKDLESYLGNIALMNVTRFWPLSSSYLNSIITRGGRKKPWFSHSLQWLWLLLVLLKGQQTPNPIPTSLPLSEHCWTWQQTHPQWSILLSAQQPAARSSGPLRSSASDGNHSLQWCSACDLEWQESSLAMEPRDLSVNNYLC